MTSTVYVIRTQTLAEAHQASRLNSPAPNVQATNNVLDIQTATTNTMPMGIRAAREQTRRIRGGPQRYNDYHNQKHFRQVEKQAPPPYVPNAAAAAQYRQ